MTKAYLDLIVDLEVQLQRLTEAIATKTEPLTVNKQNDVQAWVRFHAEIQAFFQSQIVNTDLEVIPKHLSLQVEINKQLQMMGMDLLMLQSALQAATWQKRHQQVSDRLVMLKRYCQMHSSKLNETY